MWSLCQNFEGAPLLHDCPATAWLHTATARLHRVEFMERDKIAHQHWDNYKVLVHPKLKDYNPESGIRQYENRQFYLPANEKFYPSLIQLHEHRKRFGYN